MIQTEATLFSRRKLMNHTDGLSYHLFEMCPSNERKRDTKTRALGNLVLYYLQLSGRPLRQSNQWIKNRCELQLCLLSSSHHRH